jgi:hypothetical protein
MASTFRLIITLSMGFLIYGCHTDWQLTETLIILWNAGHLALIPDRLITEIPVLIPYLGYILLLQGTITHTYMLQYQYHTVITVTYACLSRYSTQLFSTTFSPAYRISVLWWNSMI